MADNDNLPISAPGSMHQNPTTGGATTMDCNSSSSEEEENDHWYNYCTISRWRHRVKLWKEYMDRSEPKELPEAKEFLYSGNIMGDEDSVQQLIWGEKGLKSLYMELKEMESELEALVNDNVYQDALSSDHSINVDEQELNEVPAKYQRLMQDELKIQEKIIKIRKERIKVTAAHIKDREGRIKDRQGRIKDRKARIDNKLTCILLSHENTWSTLSVLVDKAYETFTGSGFCSVSLDENRFNKSPACQPRPSPVEQMRSAAPDREFLTDLLEKKDIIIHQKDNLFKLQTFLAAIQEYATVANDETKQTNDEFDKKIKATVDAILNWKPETTVESLGPLKGKLGWPRSNGNEKDADQRILCALVSRIVALLGQSSNDEYREFIHVIFPEMLGQVFVLKPTSQDDPSAFAKNQRKGREQVMGQLAKRLLRAFHFGGIGEDDLVCGVVLSMVSIQVLEMQLTGIGTTRVNIAFRQTAHVPLLGEKFVPICIRKKVAWDMGCDGVLLLASVMIDLLRKPLFGSSIDKEQTLDDVSAKKYCSEHGHEQQEHVDIKCSIQSRLGSGSFSHVVRLGEQMFMKIPQDMRVGQLLKWECEILGKLAQDQKSWFPKIMPWGVSVVALSIRNEISRMKVLRLKGIVGCPLGSRSSDMKKEDVHRVTQEVYKALEYAHSKGIFHMDVQPSNIIVRPKEEGWDVLLSDWGCSMLENETIEKDRFVGCTPYAHDNLLGKRDGELQPKADFDFASLGYTWYHVIKGVIDWQFDWPQNVSEEQIEGRRAQMQTFFNNGTDSLIPRVREIFDQADSEPDSG